MTKEERSKLAIFVTLITHLPLELSSDLSIWFASKRASSQVAIPRNKDGERDSSRRYAEYTKAREERERRYNEMVLGYTGGCIVPVGCICGRE